MLHKLFLSGVKKKVLLIFFKQYVIHPQASSNYTNYNLTTTDCGMSKQVRNVSAGVDYPRSQCLVGDDTFVSMR